MRDSHGLCKAAIGSSTHAERAAELLRKAAIRTEVVKISSGQKSGCTYGIALPCEQRRNAAEILGRQRIPVRGWTED